MIPLLSYHCILESLLSLSFYLSLSLSFDPYNYYTLSSSSSFLSSHPESVERDHVTQIDNHWVKTAYPQLSIFVYSNLTRIIIYDYIIINTWSVKILCHVLCMRTINMRSIILNKFVFIDIKDQICKRCYYHRYLLKRIYILTSRFKKRKMK